MTLSGTNLAALESQQKRLYRPAAVVVPAVRIFPAAVHVQIASATMVTHPPTKPIGIVNPVTALVPVMWKNGPLSAVAPATEATAAVTSCGAELLPHPGTQLLVTELHSHCSPVFVLR